MTVTLETNWTSVVYKTDSRTPVIQEAVYNKFKQKKDFKPTKITLTEFNGSQILIIGKFDGKVNYCVENLN